MSDSSRFTDGMSEAMEKEVNNIWVELLLREECKINDGLYDATGSKCVLDRVNFDLSKNMKAYGNYCHEKKTISLSTHLLRSCPWEAVIFVLKHEKAHQIVHSYFGIHDEAHAGHGDAFRAACAMLGISGDRYVYESELRNMTGCHDDDPIVSKIKKLMAKGQDSAVTEEEANAFLMKANDMMREYNISLNGERDIFVKRPVAAGEKRFKKWYSYVGQLVSEYYNIRAITCYVGGHKYLTFFGEPHNVDVAEYIFHSIVNLTKIAYDKYKKEHVLGCGRRHSIMSFAAGVVTGYRDKLEANAREVEMANEMHGVNGLNGLIGNEVMIVQDEKLTKKYHEAFPCRKKAGSVQRIRGASYDGGLVTGNGMTLHNGVGVGRVKMLN